MGDRLRAGTQNVKSCKLYVICTRVDIWTASYVHCSSCLVTAPARPDCHSELIFINSAKPLFTVLRTRHSPYLYCTAVLNVTQMPSYWVHNGPKRFNFENCILVFYAQCFQSEYWLANETSLVAGMTIASSSESRLTTLVYRQWRQTSDMPVSWLCA